jgi:signal transduction histidine kinase
MITTTAELIERGELSFSIESRIIRELGERLVKLPEVALLELVKNAYDADAAECSIQYDYPDQVIIDDDGNGMSFAGFKNGWMRIGTSAKVTGAQTEKYGRAITGEKGIGRFAVRFLGRRLRLTSIAMDDERGYVTNLVADFDWPEFDKHEDLGQVRVPYTLTRAEDGAGTGTTLTITELSPDVASVNFRVLRTSSMGIVTPYRSLLQTPVVTKRKGSQQDEYEDDPGFNLQIVGESIDEKEEDVARAVLDSFVLRAVVEVTDKRLKLKVFERGVAEPELSISDEIENVTGPIYADIRFFPHRAGTFRGLSVDGRVAKTWIKGHAGVAVFDRAFRVHPYGTSADDWLRLAADKAKNHREPRSVISNRHFPMDEATKSSTELNYMLRLPYPEQLVGIVQVQGRRSVDSAKQKGLIPAADREGFLQNAAYVQLWDVIRGAVEAIAKVDREIQQDEKARETQETLAQLKRETRQAIKEIERNPNIARSVKLALVQSLVNTQRAAQKVNELSKERAATLEVMSLLGVVAGFMTHEFGTAIDDLQKAHEIIAKLAKKQPDLSDYAVRIAQRIASLNDFVSYSQGYIHGAAQPPAKPYMARPRIQQVIRVFGKYADERGIKVNNEIDVELSAPLVPVALYNGVALNLYTNALKAITAKMGSKDRRIIFRAWNEEDDHFLEVSDTGIGIPSALRERVFDPLFTTTSANRDPLGSGIGLGLTLVERGVKAFGGRVALIDPPPGFTTCFQVRLPLTEVKR